MKANNGKYGLLTCISVVVANMVGTGIFTSLGFQVMDLHSGFAIIVLWVLGGIAALFGAFCYGELGAVMPRSGGEYHFLSKLYHPLLGFMAGWVSFTVGFAAAIAAAAMAMAGYFCESINCHTILPFTNNATIIAILVILFFTALHSLSRKTGAVFQNGITILKIMAIIGFIFIGLMYGNSNQVSFSMNNLALKELFSPAFAIALYFVSYSYFGWNAAVYIAGEIKNPAKNLPKSLMVGTAVVIILYVLLNYVFLKTIPIAEMSGKIEIGFLFGTRVFGNVAGKTIGLVFAFLLLSTISSMVIAGPRVTQVMGNDYKFFKLFAHKSRKGLPIAAICAQSLFAIVYIVTATFDQVIVYMGFTLNLFSLLTVAGLFVHRRKYPEVKRPYKTFGYPMVPAVFIVFNTWLLIYGLIYKPWESLFGLGTIATGLVIYFIIVVRKTPDADLH